MTISDIFQIISNIIANQDFLFRIILIVFLSLYALFSLVVAREISLLNNIVNQISFSPIFKLLAWFNIAFSIALLAAIIITI